MILSITRATWVKLREGEVPSSMRKNAGHRKANTLQFVAFTWLMFIAVSPRVQAYTFLTPMSVWPDGTIPMDLQLGSASIALMDGNTSWKAVAENALAAWNPYIDTIQFTVYSLSPGPIANGDGINQAFFSSSVYGQAFGSGVLAVTTRWTIGARRTEGDTIFNFGVPWNSYRGPLQLARSGGQLNDFQRVGT